MTQDEEIQAEFRFYTLTDGKMYWFPSPNYDPELTDYEDIGTEGTFAEKADELSGA